jgi:hypothetical protein
LLFDARIAARGRSKRHVQEFVDAIARHPLTAATPRSV